MSQPSKLELVVKGIIYRLMVIVYEGILGIFIGLIGYNIMEFIIVNNMVKLIGYILMELWWFGYIRTRLQLLHRYIISKLRGR